MRRRFRLVLIFLMVVLGACLIAWRLVPRDRLLLEHARHVADTTQWGLGGKRFNESIRNHWLSDHEVLFDRFEGAQHDQRVIYKRDIATGQETKLPGLTAHRRTLGEEVVDSECVSPDGKWYTCSARWNECLLAEVNGTRHFLYPYTGEGDHHREILWLPDSRHWLERYGYDANLNMVMHDTQNLKASVKLSRNANSTLANIDMTASPDKAVLIQWPDEVMNDMGKPIMKANSSPTKTVTILLMSLQSDGKPLNRCALAVPFDSRALRVQGFTNSDSRRLARSCAYRIAFAGMAASLLSLREAHPLQHNNSMGQQYRRQQQA